MNNRDDLRRYFKDESDDFSTSDILILIVDDIPTNIQLLGKILKQEGYRIAIATNGREAIEFLDRRLPDLVLLDIMMPEMDGYTACRKMKSNPETAHIPVVFLTAKSDIEDKIKAFSTGGADYITKPFQSAEVIARVHHHARLKWTGDKLDSYLNKLETVVEERTRAYIQAERQATMALMIEGLVHNLKNPVTTIYGGAQLLEDVHYRMTELTARVNNGDALDMEKLQSGINSIERFGKLIQSGSEKLTGMINNLMARSRANRKDELTTLDLNTLLRREIDFLHANLAFKMMSKKIELCAGDIMVEVVPGEIAQVFQNLVQNALDVLYDCSGPCIRISSGIDRHTSSAWLSVEDNGGGVDENIAEKIFSPFFSTKPRADDECGDKPTGTGLGLYICRDMVESNGGKIHLINNAPHGCTFKIEMPLAVAALPKKKSLDLQKTP